MPADENKAVFRKLVEGLNKGNVGIMDEVYAPNLTYHGTGQMAGADRESFKQFMGAILAAFPDSHMTIDELLADGDKVIYRMTYTGTHKGELMGIPATDKAVRVRTIGIARVSGGKIVEEWENMDEMGIMQQLGLVPEAGQGES